MSKFPPTLYQGAVKLIKDPVYAKPLEQVFKKIRDVSFPRNKDNIITSPDPVTESNLNSAYTYSSTQLATMLDNRAVVKLTPLCISKLLPPPAPKALAYKILQARIYNSFVNNAKNLQSKQNNFDDNFVLMKKEYLENIKKSTGLPEPVDSLYIIAFE